MQQSKTNTLFFTIQACSWVFIIKIKTIKEYKQRKANPQLILARQLLYSNKCTPLKGNRMFRGHWLTLLQEDSALPSFAQLHLHISWRGCLLILFFKSFFFIFLVLLMYGWFTRLWWFLLHNKVTQLDIYTHPFCFRFFSNIDDHRILGKSSLCYTAGPHWPVIPYRIVCIYQPQTPSPSPPPACTCSFGNHKFLKACDSISVLQVSSFVRMF